MSRNRWIVMGGVLAVAAGVAVATRRGPEPALVEVARVKRVDRLQSFVTASGEIVATRYADIGSSVMGRLVALSVREGDRVRAGQVLARIDPVQADSLAQSADAATRALEAEAAAAGDQVRAAQADLEAARARATETGKALIRARELWAAGLIAPADLDGAVAAAAAAEAQVNAAAAALARAEQAQEAATRRVAQARADAARARDQLAKTEITAPIDGIVTRLDVEEGEMVVIGVQNQPGTILMTISDLSAIDTEVKVAEADVLRLALGDPATVTLEAVPGQRFAGRVVEIGASALPQVGQQAAAREFKVTVRLEGDTARLRPGLTCDAEILVEERASVLTVPLQAVVERLGDAGATRGVFRVEDGTAVFTPVTTGIIGGLTIEVEGIDEGTAVVAGPFQVLRDLQSGARVRPQ
jgi:HlyD family secretion protein